MKILFATTNKAKVKFYATRLKEKGIDIVTLDDLNITKDVEENGNTPLENAIIKATEYYKISGLPTIAVDDGLYFYNVPEHIQPGTHVKRVNGKKLNDDEMIEHYINLVNEYGNNGELKVYFLKGIALVYDDNVQSFENKGDRLFVNRKSEVLDEGYPLASIQIIPSLNKFKSELTREEEALTMDIEHKPIFDFLFEALEKIENKIKN